MRTNVAILPLIVVAVLTTSACAFATAKSPAPDLTKIERTIAKQPTYTSKRPRYGLLAFGDRAATHAWAVFDKSSADGATYDVLYFDRNANGDLTDDGERIAGKPEGKESLIFTVGEFKDAQSGDTHTDVALQMWLSEDDDGGDRDEHPFTVDLFVRHKGKTVIHAGFDERPSAECNFTTRPTDAPIFWFGEGRLTASRFGWDKLTIGGTQVIRLLVGQRGLGRGSFAAVPEDYLPKDMPIVTTLVYKDAGGNERTAITKLTGRCCGTLYHGPIEVPADAAPGEAIVRCTLPEDAKVPFAPAEIRVKLVAGKTKK